MTHHACWGYSIPLKIALEMANLIDVPIVPVLFISVLFFDLEVVGQLLPLPLYNVYLTGSLGGSISLCIILGFFPHELFCFAALSLSVLALLFLLFVPCIAVNDAVY